MLVLSRKQDQTVVINADITIKVLGVHRNRVRLGIEAPDNLVVLRGELTERDGPQHKPSDLIGDAAVAFA